MPLTKAYFVATVVDRVLVWSGQLEYVPLVDHFVTVNNEVYMVTALNWLLGDPAHLPELEVELVKQQ